MKIAIIGCGKMGSAIATAIVGNNVVRGKDLFLVDSDLKKSKKLSRQLKANICKDYSELAKIIDTLIIAVKPNDVQNLLDKIKNLLTRKHLVISVAAALEIKFFESQLKARIVRVVPNLPLAINEGMTVFTLGKTATKQDKKLVERIFGPAGKILEIKEELMDISLIAFSCMPGWSSYLMNLFISTAKRYGLNEKEARLMVAQGFYGTAKYIVETDTKPESLVELCATKGGITAAGLEEFENSNIREIIVNAIAKAMEQTLRLRKEVRLSK